MLGATLGLILGCVGQALCPPPAPNGPMPANTPGFFLVDIETVDAGAPITRVDGGAFATERSAGVVRPVDALVPGETYLLRQGCFGQVVEQPFTVSPAQPLPTKTGTLKVSRREVHRITVDCFEEIDAAVVQFAFTPDPGLAPFVSALSWTLEIDGKTNWVTLPQGSLDAKGSMVRFVGAQHSLTAVHSACRAATDPGLAAGFHIARLRASLPGAEPLAAAEADFTIDCGGGCGCGASSPGAFALCALAWLVRRRFS